MSESTYRFKVKMTCGGCSGAVDRVLKKTEGINSYDISLETQEVIVRTRDVSYEDVLAKIKKTGKEVQSGEIVGGGPQAV
ncbi:copper metallochaperone ATX1 [Sporobolomyces koalae]|uniref:copper metallochaperone ATX1 n=1 Tax=Sporobolomyces koalae TaxID=500713 RepID=UPI0031750EC1